MLRPDWQSLQGCGVVRYNNGDELCNELGQLLNDGEDALILCEATVRVPPFSVYAVMQEVCELIEDVQAEVGVVALVGPQAHTQPGANQYDASLLGRRRLVRALHEFTTEHSERAAYVELEEEPTVVAAVERLRQVQNERLQSLIQRMLLETRGIASVLRGCGGTAGESGA